VTRTLAVAGSDGSRRWLVEKAVASEHGDADATAALINEAAVLNRVEGPGVARPIELRTVGSSPVLLVEDAGTSTLKDRTRRPFDVGAFFDLAIRLAEILAHVHERDVIHRDIHPSNIVLDPGGSPTLVDFDRAVAGSATVLGLRDEVLNEPSFLPYASPEQVGRHRRVVDRRSDLYSLGAVFYEMLTGTPPFRHPDPLELVHAHLARTPVSPSLLGVGVPAQLSSIVLKLLSRAPELRYQSSAALVMDLREARNRWRKGGEIEPFELGTLDLALELPLPDRLYGREPELAAIRAAYSRVAKGGAELVLVSGDAGIGKSTIAQAVREEVTAPRAQGPSTAGAGRFLSGKSDLRAANVPLGSLLEALRGLVRDLEQQSAESRSQSRDQILRAVGVNGRILTDLLPELEEIIGEQPPPTPLEPLEAQTRLYTTLKSFVQAFASEERPLVLFIDDLQWSDGASLAAMRALATDPESKYLLLLGSYRPREVEPDRAFWRFDEDLKRGRMAHVRVDVGPLSSKAVEVWLGEVLRADAPRAAPLAELLTTKSGGNPFFLRQLLASLHRSRHLSFDPHRRRWNWSLSEIERVSVTENVVQLLLEAMHPLPAETREVLQVASCVGKTANIALLVELVDRPESEVRSALTPAVCKGLMAIEPTSGEVHFAHDRVQDAAYSMISESCRQELHLRIGRVLEARGASGTADTTFDAADQMNAGAGGLHDDAARLDLARLDYRAGLKAKASAAFEPALAYLRFALAALPDGAWKTEPTWAMEVQRSAAECAYLSGNYELSDRLVEEALGRATSTLQKADLYSLRVASASARAAWQRALDQGRHALAELGYTLLCDRDIEACVADDERAIDELLGGAGPEALLDVPPITEPTDKFILHLLVNLAHPAWWLRKRGLFRLLTLRALRFILERGHGPESGVAVCQFAMCLAAEDKFETADDYGRIAQELGRRFPDPVQQMRSEHLYTSFIERWRRSYAWVIPRIQRIAASSERIGDLRIASSALSSWLIFSFAAGHGLDDVLHNLTKVMPFLRRTRNEGIVTYRQAIRCLKGLTSARNEFGDEGFDEGSFLRAAEGVPTLSCLYWMRRLHTSLIFRDFATARRCADTAERLVESMGGYIPSVDYLAYRSLSLAACCTSAPSENRTQWLAEIARNQRRLARWAESNPAIFRHQYVLVEAELARLDQRFAEATDLYEEAIEVASTGGFLHDAAVASELAGRHARDRGRIRRGDVFIREARERYARWGATEKVRALEEEFPAMGRSTGPTVGGRPHDTNLDLVSLFKSAEAIATEVVLDRLLQRLIRACAEAAGADRVAVILEEDGQPVVRAIGDATGPVDLDRVPFSSSVPVARATIEQARTTRSPAVVDDAPDDPRLASDPYVRSRSLKSILALPVQRGATLVATLYFENSLVSRAFTGPRLRVLDLLSSHIASALENSVLFEKLKGEIAERRRAENSLRFLAGAGARLSETLDSSQIAERLVHLVVPAMADWCCVDVVDPEQGIRRLACVHRNPQKAEAAAEFVRRGVPDWQPPATVLRSGTAVHLEEVDERRLDPTSVAPDDVQLLRTLGTSSLLSVPMITHGRTVGVVTLVLSGNRRRFGPDEITVAQEIAQRSALAIDNARLFQQAQDAVRIREEFLSVAAHELHTPITSLHLMVQAISSGKKPLTTETVRDTFGVADRQVRRLIRLVDELLDVSRIDARRFCLSPEPFDLAALAKEVAVRFAEDARRARSVIEVRAEEPVHGVWDRSRIDQVISNLLSNAVKFGAGQPIAVVVSGAQGHATLSIVDHGIGVPREGSRRIFGRFERAVSERHYGGLGLGLYIVETIVENLGGKVFCKDTPGGGATFVVDLPCDPTGEATADGPLVSTLEEGAQLTERWPRPGRIDRV
jgi:predicted ATPase/signal transduction histidine kinase